VSTVHIIECPDLDALFDALADRGHTIVGPTVRDRAIVFDEIRHVTELPIGWTDDQDGGHYRLRRREDQALFGYAVGPHSWKRYQLPPQVSVWQARVDAQGGLTELAPPPPVQRRYAFIGARSCDLHAIGILERVIGQTSLPPFIVAVQCAQAGGTCFCVSMNTGPVATSGFDLALTEVLDGARHQFVVEIGSEAGAEVLADVPHRAATGADRDRAHAIHARTVTEMGRQLDTSGIKELLYRNYEHPRWDEVAERCLTCGNCTMVCPTCFCTTVEDVTDLDGERVERRQQWDSCFTVDYSHVHGGAMRSSARSRYRQWMTHKLATWWDQFDTSGCVGCGRCITWCPVGIDITEELQAIRMTEDASREGD
jgi:sulfhydrogenase subunit beta (sulfur reductase)